MTRFRKIPFSLVHEPDLDDNASVGFVDQLRHRLSGGSVMHERLLYAALTLHGTTLCWIDVENNRAMMAEPGAQTLLSFQVALAQSLGALALAPLTRDAFERQAHYTRCLALRPMLWQAGLDACSANVPLAPLAAGSVLQLQRWPDFRVLGHRHDDVRICALLIRRAMDVDSCSAALALTTAQVQAFFNAAYLSGYAHLVHAAPVRALRTGRGRGLAQLWRDVRTRWSA